VPLLVEGATLPVEGARDSLQLPVEEGWVARSTAIITSTIIAAVPPPLAIPPRGAQDERPLEDREVVGMWA